MRVFEIIVGPDEVLPCVSFHMSFQSAPGLWADPKGWDERGGWAGSGPREPTLRRWLDAARRNLVLPPPVRKANLGWSDAVVGSASNPGTSDASGGIVIRWSW